MQAKDTASKRSFITSTMSAEIRTKEVSRRAPEYSKSHQRGGAENLELKVVLHGNGVGLLKSAKDNQKLQSAVTSLKTQNVSFHVCKNTLRGRKISYENDLFEVFEDDIVASGVAELSHLQQQGYTYIKP